MSPTGFVCSEAELWRWLNGKALTSSLGWSVDEIITWHILGRGWKQEVGLVQEWFRGATLWTLASPWSPHIYLLFHPVFWLTWNKRSSTLSTMMLCLPLRSLPEARWPKTKTSKIQLFSTQLFMSGILWHRREANIMGMCIEKISRQKQQKCQIIGK